LLNICITNKYEPCPIIETNAPIAPSNVRHDDNANKQSFGVKAWPNPSNTTFNVQLVSENYDDKATIYVFNMNNILVHTAEFRAGDKYNFGNELAVGVYIVKVVQGKNMKHVRLVKY